MQETRTDDEPTQPTPKVVAVVVTYNRRNLLEATLTCLAKQIHALEHTVIVDNASADGTEEFLAAAASPTLSVHRMSKNLGGAGGFAAGIEAASKFRSDFIWVMDDDILFEPDTLARLLEANTYLNAKNVRPSFLIPNIFNPEGEPVNAPVLDLRIQSNGNMLITRFLERGLLPAVSASFVGMLIPRQAIDQHGLPIAEMFIWGDDTEYSFRLTKGREAGFVVGSAKITHLGRAVELSLTAERDPKRAALYFYFYRNNIYNLRKYGSRQKRAAFALSLLKSAASLTRHGDWAKLKVLGRGVFAGLIFAPRQRRPGFPDSGRARG